MFNRKILAAAIAVSFAGSASAAVDLGATPINPADYASETVASAALNNGARVALSAAGSLDVVAPLGSAFVDDDVIFVRYDLINAVFNTQLDTTDITFTDTSAGGTGIDGLIVAQRGGPGESFVIFEVAINGAQGAADDDTLTLAPTDIGLITPGVDASITFAVYDDLGEATNQITPTQSITGPYINQASGLIVEFAADNSTALVATDFLGLNEGVIGQLELTTNTTLLSANDGLVITRADLLNDTASTVTVEGDFSFMLPGSGGSVNLNSSGLCSSTGILGNFVVNPAGSAATLTNTTQLADGVRRNVCFAPDGVTQILDTANYTATFNFDQGDNGIVSPTSGTLGRISRDGTTLEYPYVTTFSAYNQRIIIVNRGGLDADYRCSFVAEDGVTAAPGAAANGVVPAGEKVVIRAADMVTLTGGSRVSMRCDLDAVAGNIDAGTTLVNLSTGGTDTIYVQ